MAFGASSVVTICFRMAAPFPFPERVLPQVLASFDRASERDLIGELEIASVRNAARDARDAKAATGELAREKQRGRFAVDGRGRCDEHFRDLAFVESSLQGFEREIFR